MTANDKIEMLDSHVMQMHDSKESLMEKENADREKLEIRLNERQEEIAKNETTLSKIKKENNDQNNAKNSLHQRIVDIEKELSDHTFAQKRLETKQ